MRVSRTAKVAIVLAVAGLLSLLAASYAMVATMQDEKAGDGYPGGFMHALIMQSPRFFIWALFLPLIVREVRAHPIEGARPPAWLIRFFGIGAALAIVHYAVRSYFMHRIGHGYGPAGGLAPFVRHFVSYGPSQIPIAFIEYLFIFGGTVGVYWFRRQRERELLTSQLAAQLSQAKLDALRMQLNPHFLFNAMNSISALVRTGQGTRAVSMIAGLSELLRHVLVQDQPNEVPLSDELALANKYLAIEAARFGERLAVVHEIEPETRAARVPSLILQPLIENAIRHGLTRHATGGTIRIRAFRQDGELRLEVQDDGVGIDDVGVEEGVGLRNTRARLTTLYGARQSFTIGRANGAGTIARITLPYQT